ncbi:MAG: molybdate ABC transporter substrate-binding protein [Alphaproteobacteria bacterium]|nr:molybdate ABC transporter substrate-binding protein [Alphaproteobacteria bacterium]
MKILYTLLFSFLLSSLHAEINLAVAANMRETMDLLVAEFQKTSDVKINIISGASGELFHQISNGAPFQLFISADTEYPKKLSQKKLTLDEPYIYAYGLLVIAGKNIKIKSLEDITNKKISYIAIANPNLAPYGTKAMEILKNQNLLDKIKTKIIFGNSINDVNQLLLSGAVDIAFTNKSAVVLHQSLKYFEIPTDIYKPIPQAMVLIKNNDSKIVSEARLFYDFMKSQNAKQILINSGYLIP